MTEIDRLSRSLQAGNWLGIDVGSKRKKVCNFCLIESDGKGKLVVSFERGPASSGYPKINSMDDLIDSTRPPTYLKREVEESIRNVLDGAELVGRWFDHVGDSICVGFAVYRYLAVRLEPQSNAIDQQTIAAWTCSDKARSWRIRETFPSDVYKRANSRDLGEGQPGSLSSQARHVLASLVAEDVEWRGAGEVTRPASATLNRLRMIRRALYLDLVEGVAKPGDMRRRTGVSGDLWDAFTCAFTACCEDHGGAEHHGWQDAGGRRRLQSEGAIPTVRQVGSSAEGDRGESSGGA